jgi:hypothetical protein
MKNKRNTRNPRQTNKTNKLAISEAEFVSAVMILHVFRFAQVKFSKYLRCFLLLKDCPKGKVKSLLQNCGGWQQQLLLFASFFGGEKPGSGSGITRNAEGLVWYVFASVALLLYRATLL